MQNQLVCTATLYIMIAVQVTLIVETIASHTRKHDGQSGTESGM